VAEISDYSERAVNMVMNFQAVQIGGKITSLAQRLFADEDGFFCVKLFNFTG
jgi:hypothetical protein